MATIVRPRIKRLPSAASVSSREDLIESSRRMKEADISFTHSRNEAPVADNDGAMIAIAKQALSASLLLERRPLAFLP